MRLESLCRHLARGHGASVVPAWLQLYRGLMGAPGLLPPTSGSAAPAATRLPFQDTSSGDALPLQDSGSAGALPDLSDDVDVRTVACALQLAKRILEAGAPSSLLVSHDELFNTLLGLLELTRSRGNSADGLLAPEVRVQSLHVLSGISYHLYFCPLCSVFSGVG